MIKKLIPSFIGLLLLTAWATTEADVYIGASYQDIDYSSNTSNSSVGNGFLVGYSFSPVLSLEYRQGLTSGKEIEDITSTMIMVNLSDTFLRPYIGLGHSKVNLLSGNESDFTWLGGLSFSLSDSESINFEYVSLLNKSDVDVNFVGVNWVHSF